MAENEWMLDEFERAAERTRDLPTHARPIVTRPVAVADGYVMLRRPGCIPFVAVLNALAAAGAAQPEETPDAG